ncbi:hypothetical protein KY290_025952 [Solanum tuberosum]|uniref:Uncharacterized protein n=1 Tax=Solanum tuberosum TaxID=4113 RepID=A0ABQ7UV11_SOLTU|nr:hypothetical protein KY284_024789 [Solanum tuberosum]KAH0755682.1 hypothetical protein KY290_025952 [Solanum tuberosum]
MSKDQMANSEIPGALLQDGHSSKRHPYLNDQHYSHWKDRLNFFVISNDLQAWIVIKKRPKPIPRLTGKDAIDKPFDPESFDITKDQQEVRKLNKSLPKAWETKAAILEDEDLEKMTYDELRGNLMAYEQNHINRYQKDDKKKTVAFSVAPTEVEEDIDETQSEGMALINHGVRQMLRQRPKQDFKNSDYQRNDDRCYYCGKPRHIK